MLKKGIISIVLFVGCLAGGWYVYNNLELLDNNNKSNLAFLPSKDLVFLTEAAHPSKTLEEFFSTSLVWKKLKEDSSFSKIKAVWDTVDQFCLSNGIQLTQSSFAVYKDSTKVDYLLVTNIVADTSFNESIFTSKATNSFYEFEINNLIVYGVKKDGRYLLSSSKKRLTNNVEAEYVSDNQSFLNVYKNRSSNDKTMAFGFPMKYYSHYVSKETNKWPLLDSPDWGWYTADFTEIDMVIQGFSNNSKQSIAIGFDKISQQYYDLLPSNIDQLHIINKQNLPNTLGDKELYQASQSCSCDFIEDGLSWSDEQILSFVSNYGADRYLAFKIDDKDLFWDQANYLLSNINRNDSTGIHSCASEISFESLFQITFEPNAFTFINDYLIFGINKESLQALKTNVSNKRNIKANKELYKYITSLTNTDADKRILASGFIYNSNINGGVSIVEHAAKKDSLLYSIFNYSPNFNIGGLNNDAVWELFFDAPLYDKLHLIANHRINGNDLLVQDTLNTIYLVSASGTIKWKKKLSEPIMGDIKKIDILQNAKYQMLFNTKSKLYVLDVLGRNVKGFPVALNNATNEVNMFDYDNNGAYRFMVATLNGIQNINRLGKRVDGWAKPKTRGEVELKVRHMVISNKDYLIVNDNLANVYFYSRKGEVRHTVPNTYSSSYLPVDFGNTVASSRTFYLDRSINAIKKHFFNNTSAITVLKTTDSILDFQYLRFLSPNDKNYVLTKESSIEVFDKTGNKKKSYTVSEQINDLKTTKTFFSYIDPLNKELIIQDKNDLDKVSYYTQAESYVLDTKLSYARAFIKKGKKLQMVIHPID